MSLFLGRGLKMLKHSPLVPRLISLDVFLLDNS